MTWLFPLYLAGAAAIIAPILLHLRRRPPKTRVEFSSLMFLEQTPLVTTTRSRIERWILLALRCLALLLLAAMFARPFVSREDNVAQQGRAVVVLVDRSGSMQHGDQWKAAKAKAAEWLSKLTPDDQVCIATFDRAVQNVASFDDTKKLTAAVRAAKLDPAPCGWSSSDLGKALITATTWLNDVTAARKEIIVISDLQEGASVESLRGFAWPDHVSVVLERIEPKNTDNLSLSLVSGESGMDDDAKQTSAMLRIRIANARHSSVSDFKLRWDKDSTLAAEGHLAAGATRVVRVPRPAGNQTHILHIEGDAWPFDNAMYLAPPQPREVKIVALGSTEAASSAESPLFYLSRALQPTSKLAPRVLMQSDATMPPDAAWLVMTNDTPVAQASAIKSWIEQGHQAVCLVTSTQAAFLNAMLGSEMKLSEASVKDYALLGEMEFKHPILRPFEDVRLRDFTKIHFWHYRKLESAALAPHAIARYDNGDAAWHAVPMGKGRLVLMTSGWQPKDSQLALSSKFVPLLFGMLAECGVSLEQPTQFLVDDALPEGSSAQPGFVTTKTGRLLAVNIAPEESRVAAMDVSKLTSLGVKLASSNSGNVTAQDKQRIANEEVEARQQYWVIALALLLLVLLIETWLAGRKPRAQPLTA